jgi:hypothetical protein
VQVFGLFGKKSPPASDLRFCRKPSELPYAALFEYAELTLAVSRLNRFRWFPQEPYKSHPTAYGLVHQDHGLYPDGSEVPLLPFSLEFRTGSALRPEGCLVTGFCEIGYDSTDPYFALSLFIDDPDGSIWSALEVAFSKRVIDGGRYLHFTCRRRDPGEQMPRERMNLTAEMAAERARKKALDAGEEVLPKLSFKRVGFDDEQVTKAPSWSWAWFGNSMTATGFHNAGTRKHRAQVAKWNSRDPAN